MATTVQDGKFTKVSCNKVHASHASLNHLKGKEITTDVLNVGTIKGPLGKQVITVDGTGNLSYTPIESGKPSGIRVSTSGNVTNFSTNPSGSIGVSETTLFIEYANNVESITVTEFGGTVHGPYNISSYDNSMHVVVQETGNVTITANDNGPAGYRIQHVRGVVTIANEVDFIGNGSSLDNSFSNSAIPGDILFIEYLYNIREITLTGTGGSVTTLYPKS
jgi:hypothetical protein